MNIKLLFRFGLGMMILGYTHTDAFSFQQAQPAQTTADTVYIERVPDWVADVSEVEAERFDNGKMWTFDNAPLNYFKEAYDMEPDAEWFEHARLGALRLPNCSASFVSPNGLVLTNHHCAREQVSAVSQPGEQLLDNGFYATSVDAERRMEDYHADQLIDITDVTAEIDAALEGEETDAERITARQEAIEAIQTRIQEAAGGEAAGIVVEVIELYNGGQYSAYTFKRYHDIRLVAAPELQIGYFGGDPDNFTYPRYNLDFSFYRVYDDNGEPLQTDHYFKWSLNGVSEGDAVFVIGNPGSTSRLQTVAKLEYRRDHEEPFTLNLLETRVAAMQAFSDENPEAAEELDLINTIFSLENAIKAYTGRLEGLRDPVLMARRRDAEQDFREALGKNEVLASAYGTLIDDLANLQTDLAEVTPLLGAFALNPNSSLHSNLLKRATFGYLYALQRQFGVPEENLADLKEQILTLSDRPDGLEGRLTAAHFRDMVSYLGADDAEVQTILQGRTPEEAAADLVATSAMADSAAFAGMLDTFMDSDDPGRAVGEVLGQGLITLQRAIGPLTAQEAELQSQLALARFEIYGTTFPPDATFSLRIADGVVKPYEYNGTTAPYYTTFFGMYDRFYSHEKEYPWNLPERWLNPPDGFDMSTPVNFVSTNDIIGGNSGSPVLNKDLEVVGLAFDGNIESLPGEFIYTEEVARTVSVDARGILHALDHIYDADRIVLELSSGRLVETEADADEQMPR